MRTFLPLLLLILISLSVVHSVQAASALDALSIEVYPGYVAKDGTPFAVKISFNGELNTPYQHGIWLYSGGGTGTFNQKWHCIDNKWVSGRGNYINFTTDENGNWSKWLYLRFSADAVGSGNHYIKTQIRDVNGSNIADDQRNIVFINMSTEGGWIQGHVYGADGSVLQNKIVVVNDSLGQIIGVYSTEDNLINENYPTNAGYFKISAPVGTGYSVEAYELDGTLIGKTTGVDVIAGGITTVDIAPPKAASALDALSIEVYPGYVAKDGTPTMIKVRYTGLEPNSSYDLRASIGGEDAKPFVSHYWSWEHEAWRRSDWGSKYFTTDGEGSWSGRIYLKINVDSTNYGFIKDNSIAHISISIRESGTKQYKPWYNIQTNLLDMDTSTTNGTPGGWIKGYDPSLPDSAVVIVKDNRGIVVGTYSVEDNNVDETHLIERGYFKVASPGGDFTVVILSMDGSLIRKFEHVSVTAGSITGVGDLKGFEDVPVEETITEAVALAIHPLYAADEIPFAVKVTASGFPDGDYDVKVDITDKDGNRIGRIWDPAKSKWQSTFYYVNDVLAVSDGDGYYWARLKTSEYVGKATMVVTIRSDATWKSNGHDIHVFGLDKGGWIEGYAADDAAIVVKDDGKIVGTCLVIDGSYKLFVPFGNYTLEIWEKDGTVLSRSSVSVTIPIDCSTEDEVIAPVDETVLANLSGESLDNEDANATGENGFPIWIFVPLIGVPLIGVAIAFIWTKMGGVERL